VTVSEVLALAALAGKNNTALLLPGIRACSGIEPARAWLAGRNIRGVTVNWKEDVRVWHPVKHGSGKLAAWASSTPASTHYPF